VDEGRYLAHPVEDPLHAGPDLLGGGLAARTGCGAGAAGEVGQVRPFGLVELQRPGQRIQHGLGDAAEVAPFESGVVLDAHPGQIGDLATAQPGHPPVAAVGRQAGPLGGDLGPARAEEGLDLFAVVHPSRLGREV
jgi:hypothetical protein